ncbi:rhomboid protease [Raphidocelis subcapitata]|uniref:Rhomboid protease n=1 Tax=Raphidocelis subcapitata TaxID=307507 RepID=A0A2V0PCV5_9CHLO|nr:rhomboid protease [Raphidocelis subcapitata]|eukprot:GBF97681.1 rhomboid protease [Raphidocelis subcapitata]
MQWGERSLIMGGGGGAAARAAGLWRSMRGARARAARRLRAAAGPRAGLLLGGAGSLAAGGAVASMSMAAAGAAAAGEPPEGPKPRPRGALDFGSPLRRCTDVMLVANAVLFLGQWLSRDALTLWGAKVNSLVAAGQWWRLLTSSLLHTSLFHLLINSHALHTIGPHVEMVSGRGRFAAVYVAAALFGLGAALAVFYQRHKPLLGERSDYVLRQLGLTLAINLVYSLANRRVDNWGHIGGMVGGAVVAWALGPRLVRDEASGRLLDAPPLPWLAMPAPPSGLRSALGKQADGESGGRARRKKKRGEEGDPLPDRPGAGPRP